MFYTYRWKDRKEIEKKLHDSNNNIENEERKINFENGLNKKNNKKRRQKTYKTKMDNVQCIGLLVNQHMNVLYVQKKYDQCINKWLNKGIQPNQPANKQNNVSFSQFVCVSLWSSEVRAKRECTFVQGSDCVVHVAIVVVVIYHTETHKEQ